MPKLAAIGHLRWERCVWQVIIVFPVWIQKSARSYAKRPRAAENFPSVVLVTAARHNVGTQNMVGGAVNTYERVPSGKDVIAYQEEKGLSHCVAWVIVGIIQ